MQPMHFDAGAYPRLADYRRGPALVSAAIGLGVIAAVVTASIAAPAAAQSTRQTKPRPDPTVILVHGAWADGSSWAEVIARLQERGVSVVSVQNPLTSLADDVAPVSRAVSRQEGPVVLVGHSWGGTVITQAGMSDKVAALVYIAAFAPDKAESTSDLQRGHPQPAYVGHLQADADGYLTLPAGTLQTYFAQDVPTAHARVLASTQVPMRASAFSTAVTEAAWRSKPSWYLIARKDRMIPPELQRSMADRIGARVATVASSHVPFISKPRETTALILEVVASIN